MRNQQPPYQRSNNCGSKQQAATQEERQGSFQMKLKMHKLIVNCSFQLCRILKKCLKPSQTMETQKLLSPVASLASCAAIEIRNSTSPHGICCPGTTKVHRRQFSAGKLGEKTFGHVLRCFFCGEKWRYIQGFVCSLAECG